MNWKTWLKGLGMALAGAALSSASAVVQNRIQNGKQAPPITGGNVGLSAGMGAGLAVVAYLMQSPLPIQQK